MLFSVLLGASAACAVLPALLFCINLRRFRPPAAVSADQSFSVSVLIPARNEEANIGEALEHVLASRNVDLEVLVWDDDSTDRTADIVQHLAQSNPRVRLLPGVGLPPGWNGKQHACWQLAQASTQPLLAFLDADVRVEPDLLARMSGFRAQTSAGLVSGFPRLITITWLEKLLLPLIHFVLLAFLPMRAMRRRLWPSAAAGCGQFLLAEREAYFASGSHNAIRETMHDGLLLPRVFRRAGHKTDIADITDLASVRMYDSAAKVWQGLAKNATEGIATPGKIVPLSLILLLGQVLPIPLLAAWCFLLSMARTGAGFAGDPLWTPFSAGITVVLIAAVIATILPRLLAVRRFQQPISSALLHPVGILLLLVVQWYALARKLFGKPVGWRQRTYSSDSGAEVSS
jgi:hypothetical protein